MRTLLAAVVLLLLPPAVAADPPANGTVLHREPVQLGEDAPEGAKERLVGVELERLVYSSDGLEVEAYLATPIGDADLARPGVVFLRGGNRDFGAVTSVRAAFLLGRLAQEGYVAIATNYRGNGRPGVAKYPGERVCSECESAIGGVGREEFGGAEVDDVLALIPLLEAMPGVDAERLGIYGWSRGGMMTYLTLRRTDRFRAAVVGAGVADVAASLQQRPDMAEHVYSELVPGWSEAATRAREIEKRSAVLWAEELPESTPILLLHGTADWRVDPTQALDMARALLLARRPFRLQLFEGGDHGLREYRTEVHDAVVAWLNHYVRDGGEHPSLEPHGR